MRGLGFYVSVTLYISSLLLVVMAVLVSSPPLFYMATAVIVTLLASRLQAFLAVRYLRFDRFVPAAVGIGEKVVVEVVVWSERRIKRPLVQVRDVLPTNLVVKDAVRSLPVAPSYDQPIKTYYSFRPMRRGRYSWSSLVVYGTDALGLVTLEKLHRTQQSDLVVYPAPIPVDVELRPRLGWGISELDSGKVKGSGLEPRSIREYAAGDPLKSVHWRSSARRGILMVKEFETGSGIELNFIIQTQAGTESGNSDKSSFEAMCGHALYMADQYLKQGAAVRFPVQEGPSVAHDHPEVRIRQVREILTDIQANETTTLAQTVERVIPTLSEGASLVLFLSALDPALPGVIASQPQVRAVCLLYDLDLYRSGNDRNTFGTSTKPEYIAELERAGAETHVMPEVTKLG